MSGPEEESEGQPCHSVSPAFSIPKVQAKVEVKQEEEEQEEEEESPGVAGRCYVDVAGRVVWMCVRLC